MSGFVELACGQRRKITSLIADVPSTVFLTNAHVQVCQKLAGDLRDGNAHSVLVNLLVKRSVKAKAISALSFLYENGLLDIKRIESSIMGDQFREMFSQTIEWEYQPPAKATPALDFVEVRIFLGKVVANYLFRILGWFGDRQKCDTIVRAWVDTTDSTFSDLSGQEKYLVFPFFGGVKRQWKYIRRCRKEKRWFRFCGVPFGAVDALKIMLFPGKRDQLVPDAHVRAYSKLAKELISTGVNQIYTTDEFEAASHVLYRKLSEAGVRSENRSHGAATYGPYVWYDEFRCHTEGQVDFYSICGRVNQFKLRKRHCPELSRLDGLPETYRPVLIYLLGNWKNAGKAYEANVERNAVSKLVQCAQDLKLPIVLKSHPNLRTAERRKWNREFEVPVVEDCELEDRHPVFLTLLSSSYFEYRKYGPTFAFSSETLRPDLLLGPGVQTVDLESDYSELEKFRFADHWEESFKRQNRLGDWKSEVTPNRVAQK